MQSEYKKLLSQITVGVFSNSYDISSMRLHMELSVKNPFFPLYQ